MAEYEVSEGIARGHPDKLADQISDAILDACLTQDEASRVAVETLVSHNLITIAGEITTRAQFDIESIVAQVIKDIGYASEQFGDLLEHLNLVQSIEQQSQDIAQAVGKRGHLAAGDQGMMYGFACNQTSTYMPLSYEIARTLVRAIHTKNIPILGPDGKTQICLSPKETSVLISWQHVKEASQQDVQQELLPIIKEVCDQFSITPTTICINPSGRFVKGGPFADTGLTGRKQIVDSYGGSVCHGGGAFSGKDATKVDRSGAYMARYVAKHVVAARLASVCEVQLIFAIGKPEPINIGLDCFGTEKIPLQQVKQAILHTFNFSVEEIISHLNLTSPIFQQTAWGGHFGRLEFPWEQLDQLDTLLGFCFV